MEFIDTHCHIHEASTETVGDALVRDKWAKDGFTTSDTLIKEAHGEGVRNLICVGCTLRDSEMAAELAKRSQYCYASIGIHPHEAKDHLGEHSLSKFSDLLHDKAAKIVAIGECGLDYFYEHSSKSQQMEILRFQLNLAQQHDLPVIFHVRDAFDDFWPVFDKFKGLRGVIHSFSADTKVLDQILARGLYVGLNGIMTFAKDNEQLAAAKAIPRDSLLLETDAPFLTPVPYRGTICQPKHVVETAKFLSHLRHESLEDLARATTQNAKALFNLK